MYVTKRCGPPIVEYEIAKLTNLQCDVKGVVKLASVVEVSKSRMSTYNAALG